MSKEKTETENESWADAMGFGAELRVKEIEDVIAYRAWMRSNAYWLRALTVAMLQGGTDGRTAVASSAVALGAIAASEKLMEDES